MAVVNAVGVGELANQSLSFDPTDAQRQGGPAGLPWPCSLATQPTAPFQEAAASLVKLHLDTAQPPMFSVAPVLTALGLQLAVKYQPRSFASDPVF